MLATTRASSWQPPQPTSRTSQKSHPEGCVSCTLYGNISLFCFNFFLTFLYIKWKCYLIILVALFNPASTNGQIGSLKSSEFQEFFSQGKHGLRMLIFLLTFSYLPYFNPQKIKPAIFLCGPRQMILNIRRSSQNMKNWLLPVFTLQSKLIIYTLMTIFWRIFF
jgi:hypothetical protein